MSTSQQVPASEAVSDGIAAEPLCHTPRFAAIIPIGPTKEHLQGATDLVDSLLVWEPRIVACVFVENRPQASGLAEFTSSRSGCQARSFKNPGWISQSHWACGVNAGILSALSWLHAHNDLDFVLRLDTDALVIAPFAENIQSFLRRQIDAGVIGSLNGSCNPAVRAFFDEQAEPTLLRLRRLLPSAPPVGRSERAKQVEVRGLRYVSMELLRSFDAVRAHIDDAIRNGYASGRHCQGGALAVTGVMLQRMAAAGYLRSAEAWLDIPAGDDMVLAMYSYAVGLRPLDCEAFGVQFRALPYPLGELIERGYSVVHSVENDRRYSEADIRRFFRERRIACRHQ